MNTVVYLKLSAVVVIICVVAWNWKYGYICIGRCLPPANSVCHGAIFPTSYATRYYNSGGSLQHYLCYPRSIATWSSQLIFFLMSGTVETSDVRNLKAADSNLRAITFTMVYMSMPGRIYMKASKHTHSSKRRMGILVIDNWDGTLFRYGRHTKLY